jgi:hypothetical protein
MLVVVVAHQVELLLMVQAVQVVVVLLQAHLEIPELLILAVVEVADQTEELQAVTVAQALSSSLTLALNNLVAVSSHPWAATRSTPSIHQAHSAH